MKIKILELGVNELITDLESGPLTEEDEDVIGYRKREITPKEEEQIYMDALNKYLPSMD